MTIYASLKSPNAIYQEIVKSIELIQFQMLKDQTVIGKQNSFSITRFQPQCYYEVVTMDFNPPVNLNKASNSIVPSFCRDKKFYTPAFILPRQQVFQEDIQEYYEKDSLFEKTKFEERVFKAISLSKELDLQDKGQNKLNMAIPSELYCQVCKATFSTYFEHISQESHQKISQSNSANLYIADLCQAYENKTDLQTLYVKNKKIKKKEQNRFLKKQRQEVLPTKTRSQRRKLLQDEVICSIN